MSGATSPTNSNRQKQQNSIFPVEDEGKSLKILSLCWQLFQSRVLDYFVLTLTMLIPLGTLELILYFYPGDNIFAKAVFVGDYYRLFRGVLSIIMFLLALVGEGAMIRLTSNIFAGTQAEGLWQSVKSNLNVGFFNSFKVALTGLTIYSEVYLTLFIFCLLDFGISSIKALPLVVAGLLRVLAGLLFAVPLMFSITGPYLYFPAIIVENKGMGESLKRSWKLAKERIYFVFVFIFPLGFIRLLFADMILSVYVEYSIAPTLSGYIAIMFLPTLLFLPAQAILRFVLYAKLRTEKEGISEADLQAQLAEGREVSADAGTSAPSVNITKRDENEGIEAMLQESAESNRIYNPPRTPNKSTQELV
ncbi:hypothetical protein ACA910_014138 [Epithemia clementina (nom. ined.)]